MDNNSEFHFILGLDIGATSVGWSVTRLDTSGNPEKLTEIGVRVFEAGVEGDLGAIETGRDVSKAVDRRNFRSIRRNTDRTARRLSNLYSILQDSGLLPPEITKTDIEETGEFTKSGKRRNKRLLRSDMRDKAISDLDKKILNKWVGKLKENGASRTELDQLPLKLPYIIRARALDEKLDNYEIGRALYSLAQRRGFLSNRKKQPGKDEEKEEGKVKEGISELEKKIQESNSRTLGEYFSKLNPEVEKIRRIWTSRKMYEDEFEKIWSSQSRYYPDILNEDLRKKVHKAIFYQRPLKSQKGKVGWCEHEPHKRRCPIALLEAQRFRCVQMLNNARIWLPEGSFRELTPEEVKTILDELEYSDKVTFAQAGKILKLPKTLKFNYEEGEETRFIGNTTSAKLYKVFGERWKEFSESDKQKIVEDLQSIQKDETLINRGIKAWGLDNEQAVKFANISLEDGYSKLSRKAIKKLLPLMLKGMHYSEAVDEIYGFHAGTVAHDYLPPVLDAVPELTNPAVIRGMSELRKVVNALIKKYGKPSIVKIEMARELKKSRDARKEITKKNRTNKGLRYEAAEKICKETGIIADKDPDKVSSTDRLKVLLADECNWECPYTGKTISMGNLFDSSQFDIEHIIPFSRCFDNSYMNKTLCYHEENRDRKKNRTPYEAYYNSPQWDDIIDRVKRFKGDAKMAKLARFTMTHVEDLDGFTNRQLTDTQYASKLAAKYLGALYGPEFRKHVQTLTGQITAHVRDELGLNAILGDGGEKTRDDHRHHAVDAVAISLVDRSLVKRMADASKRAESVKRKLFAPIEAPWEGFYDDVKRAVNSIVVSHKVSNQVNSALHEESLYSVHEKGTSIRKRIDLLKEGDVQNIIDPAIRLIVESKLAELGGWAPNIFAEPGNVPGVVDRHGVFRRLRSVAVAVKSSPFPVGNDVTRRNVLTKSNHHVEIFEYKDKKGNLKWDGVMVSQYDAAERKRRKEPIIQRDHGLDKKFLFSLSSGSIIETDDENGGRGVYRVRTVSANSQGYMRLEFVKNSDSRLKKKIMESKGWIIKPLESLRKINCRKVVVTPIGEVRYAND